MFQKFAITVALVLFCVLFAAVTVPPAFAQLANSPWPQGYHDSKFSKVTDTQGPTTNVERRWIRTLSLRCTTAPSIGSDSFLYLTNDQTLYKINYATGETIPPTKALGVQSASQPLVATEGGADRIYTGERGKLRKFTPSLSEIMTGGWPVTLRYNLVNVFPLGIFLSPTNGTSIIFVALDNQETQTRIVLYAVEKDTGNIHTFDIKAYAENVLGISSPDVDNSVSIGPDPNHAGRELCYVLLRRGQQLNEGLLLAVGFNPTTKAFTGVEWVSDPFSPNHSETSPVVSEDGYRVYFATGIAAGQSSHLVSVNTTNGDIVAESIGIGGLALASPVIENNIWSSGNTIWIHSTGGPLYAFLDQGNSLECVWKSPDGWGMSGGNGGKSEGQSGLFYIPFTKTGGTGTLAYAGAFDVSPTAPCDPDPDDPNEPCGCVAIDAQWSLPFQNSGESDLCTRSLGFNPTTGKAQVFFGTESFLYAYE